MSKNSSPKNNCPNAATGASFGGNCSSLTKTPNLINTRQLSRRNLYQFIQILTTSPTTFCIDPDGWKHFQMVNIFRSSAKHAHNPRAIFKLGGSIPSHLYQHSLLHPYDKPFDPICGRIQPSPITASRKITNNPLIKKHMNGQSNPSMKCNPMMKSMIRTSLANTRPFTPRELLNLY